MSVCEEGFTPIAIRRIAHVDDDREK